MNDRFDIMSKYENLNKQFIDGQWLEGNGDDEIISYNPYTDQKYVRIQAASMENVDKAFKAAERAQKEWANTNSYEKHEILRKAADISEACQDEIVEILINDSGSTFAKATQEFNTTVQIIRLAETMPFKMETIANQSMIPGKRNKLIRRAKGVVGVIGPYL